MASYLMEKDKLKGEYSKIFDRVEGYTIIRAIDEDTREEMLMNLIDILYSAQVEEKPAEKIVGKDIDQFCKEYFSDCHSWQMRIKSFPSWLYGFMWFIVVISVVELIFPEEEGGSIWNATMEIGSYIFGTIAGVVSSLLFLIIGSIIWSKYKRLHSNLLYVGAVIIFLLSLIVVIRLSWGIEWEIPLIPTLLIAGFYVFVYKCWQLYDRHKRYGTFKKPPKDGSLKDIFKESMNETAHKELPLKLKKIYEKKNRRLIKRGKSEMTPEDYMKYLYKQDRKLKTGNRIVLVIYIVLLVFGVVFVALDSTWYDTLIYAAIEGVILSVIYWGVYKKLININESTRGALLRQCEEKGITVLDLAQQIKKNEQEKEM